MLLSRVDELHSAILARFDFPASRQPRLWAPLPFTTIAIRGLSWRGYCRLGAEFQRPNGIALISPRFDMRFEACAIRSAAEGSRAASASDGKTADEAPQPAQRHGLRLSAHFDAVRFSIIAFMPACVGHGPAPFTAALAYRAESAAGRR